MALALGMQPSRCSLCGASLRGCAVRLRDSEARAAAAEAALQARCESCGAAPGESFTASETRGGAKRRLVRSSAAPAGLRRRDRARARRGRRAGCGPWGRPVPEPLASAAGPDGFALPSDAPASASAAAASERDRALIEEMGHRMDDVLGAYQELLSEYTALQHTVRTFRAAGTGASDAWDGSTFISPSEA